MRTLSLIALLAVYSSSVFSQGLTMARTGIEGEGTTGRSILRIESFDTVRTLSKEELRSETRLNTNSLEQTSLSGYALDFSNVEEVTLKDGSVIKIEELEERMLNSITILE